MTTAQGFKIELHVPTSDVRTRLHQHAGAARFVYNTCLAAVKVNLSQRAAEKTYDIPADQLTPSMNWHAVALEMYWKTVRANVAPWFGEDKISSRVAKEACRNLAKALGNWSASRAGKRKGKRVGFPKFKKLSKGRKFAFDEARAYPLNNKQIHVPNVGVLAALEDMSWLSDRLSAGFARITSSVLSEKAGRWWISFKISVDRASLDTKRQPPANAPAVGVDLGLKTLATIAGSDGEIKEVASLRPLLASARRVRKLNKKLSRAQEGSKNREKVKQQLGQAHLRVANQRKDYLHKLTTGLATTKQTIVIEDLNAAGMVKNKRLAKAVYDAAFGEFRRQLEYKTLWYGSTLVTADRWYPSTKMCSGCGHVKDEMPLSVRVYECSECDLVLDRDVNAALNLLALASSTPSNLVLTG